MEMEPEQEVHPKSTATFDFMSLPSEIRGKIYNKLPQSEILPLRLVSHAWATEIFELYEFSVTIDDGRGRQMKWETLSQLRITSIRILHFREEKTEFLKFPALLNTLRVRTSRIFPNNLYYLLSKCGSGLRTLEIALAGPLLSWDQFPSSLAQLDFNNVETFDVIVSTRPEETSYRSFFDPSQQPHTLFRELMTNPMRRLKRLKVDLSITSPDQVSEYSCLTLAAISDHWASLESLNFEVLQEFMGIPLTAFQPFYPRHFEGVDMKLLGRVTSVESLRLYCLTPIGINYWIDLLENQRGLKRLDINILPVSHAHFLNSILKNYRTLRELEINSLTVWSKNGDLQAFDMSVLKLCTGLVKLVLRRNVGTSTIRAYGAPELLNANQLPTSLTELNIKFFHIQTDDLTLLFDSPEAWTNLEILNLIQCGESADFGVNGTALEKITALPSIKDVEIAGLNFTNPEEVIKINKILAQYGFPENAPYFQLMTTEFGLEMYL